MYGRLKMGFRDVNGQEVEFVVPNEPPAVPTPSLAGPKEDGAIALAEINARGFVDVSFPVASNQRLDTRSITDAGDEFTITAAGGTVRLDPSQRPILINEATHTYRYFVLSKASGAGPVDHPEHQLDRWRRHAVRVGAHQHQHG